jgi:hypothetical protein
MWHVREGMPAIFRRVFGVYNEDFDYRQLAPKDRLDHFRAERERLRLEAETRELIPASEVESAIAIALKQLAQTLDALPDTLDRAAGLSPEALDVAQRCIDSARDELFEALNHAFASDNPVSG